MRLLKKNKSNQNLASAAAVIVGLENQLAEKESTANGLQESLDQLYQDAALGKRDRRKISKTKEELAAEKISGIPAADIRRIALEFAAAAPAATTMCNRGSSAHLA